MAILKFVLLLLYTTSGSWSDSIVRAVFLGTSTSSTGARMEDTLAYNSSITLNMEVVELDGGSCNGSLLLSAFANLTEYFTTELNMTYYAIIGAHCLQETKILQTVLSKMLHQQNFAVPIISLIHLPQRDREVFSMIPPANDLIDAFYLLCKHLNWTLIGLLTDISDHYMQRTSEYVVMQSRKQGVTISPVSSIHNMF